MDNVWLVNGKLIAPRGSFDGALRVSDERIVAIRRRAPQGGRRVDLRSAFLAPGFIDLHVWGDPAVVARDAVRYGTTAFLTTLGPEAPRQLLSDVARRAKTLTDTGARCLGVHLEGPFINPARGGALPHRWMRVPTLHELQRLVRASKGCVRLITLAPELSEASAAIRWCRRHDIAVSLGHSDADATQTGRAVRAGAAMVTHVFNGMRPFHHRRPTLLNIALTDPRLTAMVIADGVHVSSTALQLLVRAKEARGVALVTDSVRQQVQAWRLRKRQGAYYTSRGVLAGSCLTMIDAVRKMVHLGHAPLIDAVRMATEVPAKLIGIERSCGTIEMGKRADLVAFDRQFRVTMTMVGGRVVYQRGT